MQKQKRHYSHGELNIFEVKALPEDVKKIENKDIYYILANSETTGNHHVLEKNLGIELYEDDKGILWLRNTVPAKVSCVVKERHDTITLDPSIWEIDRAKEWDYAKEEKRNVAD